MGKKGVGLYAVLVATVAAIMIFTVATGNSVCPLYSIIGLPCPGCGLTRAWVNALSLRFTRAFEFHPLFSLVPALMVLLIGKNGELPTGKWRVGLICSIVALFVAVWVARMALFFPDRPPMNVNFDAPFLRLIRASFK
ncbi:MAG: DUF2752 domain-containing protein [Clostridiales bacterium]|jgi:hypothetical protein|nr:DUF2752 domain-containing protein [Clostridiales bacterium]